jgi:predicted solute-binding protein
MTGDGTQQHTYTLGWIPYWNLFPLKAELAKRCQNYSIDYVSGHPTEVNALLTQNRVIASPCSAVSLLLNPEFELALPLGVASNGAVQSVYLGLMGEAAAVSELVRTRLALVRDIVTDALEEHGEHPRRVAEMIWAELDQEPPNHQLDLIPKLKLSSNSATGATLAKVFYRMIFGKQAYEHVMMGAGSSNGASPASLELVIGDEALVRRGEFQKIFDLGQLWKLATQLPFVFAVWQRNGTELPQSLAQQIMQAAEVAEAKMHVDPSAYFPAQHPLTQDGQPIDLSSYWRSLYYRLGDKEMQSLMLFLCLSRSVLRLEKDDRVVVKMLRWQTSLSL